MSFNTHQIYHPLIVNSGWTSQSVSATTISAGTFYGGSLSATYVGNQNVTNQEFIYLSGTTGYVQTQINNLVNRTERLLTFQSDDFLNNDRVISSGTNINFESTSTHLGISASFPSIEVGTIGVSLTSSQTAITDFNPVGWDDSTTKATHIIITGNSYSIISGLVGGVNGRIAIISNFGSGLVILENDSSATTVGNQFKFSSNFPYFLHSKNTTITLIYNSQNGWTNYFEIINKGFKKFDDFTNIVRQTYIAGGGEYYYDTIFGGNLYNNSALLNTGTTGFGEFKIYTVTAATSTTVRAAQMGAQRRQDSESVACSVTKLKISKSNGFNVINNSCSFSTFADLRNNTASPSIGGGTNNLTGFNPAWITPITSVTQSNVTNWYTKNHPSYTPTNIPLSDSVNDWVYFGIFVNEELNSPDKGLSFFYSYDNKNYKWSSIEILNTKSGENSICANCATNDNTHLPFLLVDWFGNV